MTIKVTDLKLLIPTLSDKNEASIGSKVSCAMFTLFFRASLYGHLFLSVHRVRIMKKSTAKNLNRRYIVALGLVLAYLLISTIVLYTSPGLVWNQATQMVWHVKEEASYWFADIIMLGLDSGVSIVGITVSSVKTVSVIRNHIDESKVKNSEKIRRSAVTVQLLTANTLLLFITWFATVVSVEVARVFYDGVEQRSTPSLWKGFLFWLPSLLNSVLNPLILIVRNNIDVKAVWVSLRHKIQSPLTPREHREA